MHGLRGVDDTTKLRLIYEDFIRFSAANINFHRMMSHVASSPSRQLDWLVDEYLRESFDQRAALIRSAQKAGRFVEGDPYHLDYLFIGAVTRIFHAVYGSEEGLGQVSARAFLCGRACAGLSQPLFVSSRNAAQQREQAAANNRL